MLVDCCCVLVLCDVLHATHRVGAARQGANVFHVLPCLYNDDTFQQPKSRVLALL